MNPRRLSRTFAAAAFPLALAAALAAPPARSLAAGPSGVTIECRPASISANEEGNWRFAVVFHNHAGHGIYGDSLLVVIHPEGAAADPVRRRLIVPKDAEALSDGDSLETEVLMNATAPKARLDVFFHSHSGTGAADVATASLAAAGSVLEDGHPAIVARVGGRDVELRRFAPEPGAANGGAVLLLPGEGFEPRDVLVPASRLAQQGLAVVVVGAPGKGRSQGADDFAGPASRAAAFAGLDSLLGMPGVDPARVGAWGISRGGTLALELALERPAAFRAVASVSANYDLWASWRGSAPEARSAIEAAAGRDSAGWRARSPLRSAASFKTPLLVLHGEKDAVFPAAPAHAFADAVKAAGGDVTGRFPPQGVHELPFIESVRFLGTRLTAQR